MPIVEAHRDERWGPRPSVGARCYLEVRIRGTLSLTPKIIWRLSGRDRSETDSDVHALGAWRYLYSILSSTLATLVLVVVESSGTN